MFCTDCLRNIAENLMPNDIFILEYLNNKGANIPQYTVSRKIIKDDLKMTEHECYSSIARLECLSMIDRLVGTKSSRYFVTEVGQKSIGILENKL